MSSPILLEQRSVDRMMRADAAAAVACLRYSTCNRDGEEWGEGRKGETERRKADITARVCACREERVGERSVWQCQRRQRQRR